MSAYSSAILATSGLVAYYRLGEASGLTVADAYGSNTGTYTGSPTLGATGAIRSDSNTSAYFSGSGQYATFTSPWTTATGTFTIEAWISAGGTPQAGMAVYNGSDTEPIGQDGYGFGIGNGAGGTGAKLTGLFGKVAWLDPGYTFTDTNWHHVVLTRTAGTATFYVDGAALATKSTSTPITPTGSAAIGCRPPPNNYNYWGGIDEVAVYTTALDAATVASHYALGTAAASTTPPTLTALLDWDDSGTFVSGTDDISDRVLGVSWTRGRNADFSGEAMGQASLTLRDTDGYFSSRMDPAGTAALIPGRPLWLYGTWSSATYGLFYGRVERVSVDVPAKTVSVEAYDPLRTLSETPVTVAATTSANRTPRDYRVAVLDDAARGSINLLYNPSFEISTTGWTGGTLITSDKYAGTASLQIAGGTATTNNWLVPQLFEGETYRLSLYLKSVSGSTSVTVAVGATSQTFTITTSWARYSLTYTAPSTVGSSSAPTISISGAGTFKLDALMLTRGAGLWTYSASGAGRYPNYVANGNFDWDTTGWGGGWYNLCRNGSFESDTTGWSTAAAMPNGTTSNGTASTWARGTAHPSEGAYDLEVLGSLSSSRIITKYDFGATTFTSGVPYTARFYKFGAASTANLGLSGDYAQLVMDGSAGYKSLTWTPSADRTAVGLFFQSTNSTLYLDAVMVTGNVSPTMYQDTGPFGTAGSAVVAASTASVKYGARAAAVTIAAANDAIAYDFYQTQPLFANAVPYTASAWLRSSSGNASVTFGLAYGSGTTVDAASTAVTIGTAWTQASVTWRPEVDRSGANQYQVYLYVKQTDATARTLYVDGVRVIPGTATDDFEPGQWSLATGYETSLAYPTAVALSGDALSVLGGLNTLAATRHWIEPGTASPYYAYTTQDRTTYAALGNAETFSNDFRLLDSQELDRSQIVNVVPVTYGTAGGSTAYLTDATSVSRYGQRPAAAIDAGGYLTSQADAEARGSFTVAAYAAPRGRPTLEVTNRFPSLLSREVGERIVVTYPALGITSRSYTILRIDGEVRSGGAEWVARYQLEEYPY